MRDILFLAHRIPFPPDRGDKIRSWHMLKRLAGHARVHLACFACQPSGTVPPRSSAVGQPSCSASAHAAPASASTASGMREKIPPPTPKPAETKAEPNKGERISLSGSTPMMPPSGSAAMR